MSMTMRTKHLRLDFAEFTRAEALSGSLPTVTSQQAEEAQLVEARKTWGWTCFSDNVDDDWDHSGKTSPESRNDGEEQVPTRGKTGRDVRPDLFRHHGARFTRFRI